MSVNFSGHFLRAGILQRLNLGGVLHDLVLGSGIGVKPGSLLNSVPPPNMDRNLMWCFSGWNF